MKGTEALATVHDCRTQEEHTIHICCNKQDRSMDMHLGMKDEGGQMIACAQKVFCSKRVLSGSHRYHLTIEPGVDVAMCVLICLSVLR